MMKHACVLYKKDDTELQPRLKEWTRSYIKSSADESTYLGFELKYAKRARSMPL